MLNNILAFILLSLLTLLSISQVLSQGVNTVQDVQVLCESNDIVVVVEHDGAFTGMIYPKGLSKNSSCLVEYNEVGDSVTYTLPLKSCNTMSTDVGDGIEYFNTVVVQPHRRLVTNQGRGYHIRCRYQTHEKTVTSLFSVNPELRLLDNRLATTPLMATAAMPGTMMKIYAGLPRENKVAENVKIGDLLTLDINIDDQEIYGMKVTDCVVRDGLGWGEQQLINSEGCPVDYEIMGEFLYSPSKTTAYVTFQAHKFPYTASVYYQCNVRLCLKIPGGCDEVPPVCGIQGNNLIRRKRRQAVKKEDSPTIEVFSGLYVSEENEFEVEQATTPPEQTVFSKDKICISPRDFAIGIAIAGLILMIAVIAAILILVSKRRRKKESSTTGSSIYSGPYTNTAYSHSS